MNRRNFIKMGSSGLLVPSTFAAKSKAPEHRVSLKKNVVLVNLELGLYAPDFRNGGASSRYMTEIFSEFKGQMTYFDNLSEPGMSGGHDCQPSTFTALKYANRDL